MSAGQIQLASKGVQDEVLTANPSITYFKTKFAKQHEFSIKTKQIPFVNTNILFGDFQTCDIKAHGDIIRSIIIKTTLPSLFQPTYNYSYPTLATTFNPRFSYLDINYNSLYTYTIPDVSLYYNTTDLSWLPSVTSLVNNTFNFKTIDERVVYIGFETLEFAIFWGFKNFINFKNGLYIFRFSTSAQFDIITSGWVNSYFPYFRYYKAYAGVNIIKSVDLLIGGQVIETIPSKYIMIYNDISVPEHQQQSISNLCSTTLTNSISPVDYYLKIPFSIKNIPISTLYRQDVKLNVTFGNFEDILDSNAFNLTQFSNITILQSATANVCAFDGVSTFIVANSNIFSYKQFTSQPVLKKQLVRGLYNSSVFDGRYMYLQADPFFQRYDTVSDTLDTYNIDNITGVSQSIGVASIISFSNNSAQVLTNREYFKNTFIPCSNISYVQALSSTTCAVVNDVNIFIFDTVPTNMNSYKPYAYTPSQIPIQFTTFNSVIYYLSSSFIQTIDQTVKIPIPVGTPISIHNLNSVLYVLYSDGKLYNLINSEFVLDTKQPPTGDTILQARSLYYNFQYLIVYVTSSNLIKYFQPDTNSSGLLVTGDTDDPFMDMYLGGVFNPLNSVTSNSKFYFCTKRKLYVINNNPDTFKLVRTSTFIRTFVGKVFIIEDGTNAYAIGDHVEYVPTTSDSKSIETLNPIRFTPTPRCNLVSFDGTYVYICPTNGNSNIIMYNTQIPFLSNSAYSFVTVKNPYNSLYPNKVFTGTAISDGTYMYIWPTRPDSNVSLIDKNGDVSTYDIGSTANNKWGKTSNSYSSLLLNGIFYIATDIHVKKFDTTKNPVGFGFDSETFKSLNAGTFCFNNSTFVFLNNGIIREYDNSTISQTLTPRTTYAAPFGFVNSSYYMLRNGTTTIVYMIPSGSSGSVYSYDLSNINGIPRTTCPNLIGLNSRTACVYGGFLYIFPSGGSTTLARIAQTSTGTETTFTTLQCPGVNFVSATIYGTFILLTDDRSILYRFNPTFNIFNDESGFFKDVQNPFRNVTGTPFLQNSNIYIVSQNLTVAYNVHTGIPTFSSCSFTGTPIATSYGVSNIVVADQSNLYFTTSLQTSCIYTGSILTSVYNRPITSITADISNVYIQFNDNKMGVLDLGSNDFTGVGYFVSSVNASGISGNFVASRLNSLNTLYSIEPPSTLRQYTASTLAQVRTVSTSPAIIGGITTDANFYPLYGPSVSTINRLQIPSGSSYTGATIPLGLSISNMTGYGGPSDAYFASRTGTSNILLRYNESDSKLRTYSNLITGNTFSNITQIGSSIYFIPYTSNTVVVYNDPNINFDGTLNTPTSQGGGKISLLPKGYDDQVFLSADGGFFSSVTDTQYSAPNNSLTSQQPVYYQLPDGITDINFYQIFQTSAVNLVSYIKANYVSSSDKPSGSYMIQFFKYNDAINIPMSTVANPSTSTSILFDTNGIPLSMRHICTRLVFLSGSVLTVLNNSLSDIIDRPTDFLTSTIQLTQNESTGTYNLILSGISDINTRFTELTVNGFNIFNVVYRKIPGILYTFRRPINLSSFNFLLNFTYYYYSYGIGKNSASVIIDTGTLQSSSSSLTFNDYNGFTWTLTVNKTSYAYYTISLRVNTVIGANFYVTINNLLIDGIRVRSSYTIPSYLNTNTDVIIGNTYDTDCLFLSQVSSFNSNKIYTHPLSSNFVTEYYYLTNDSNWTPNPSFVYPYSTTPYLISNVVTSGVSSLKYYFPIVVNKLIPNVRNGTLATQDGLYQYTSSSSYQPVPLNIDYTKLPIDPNINYRFNKIGNTPNGICYFGSSVQTILSGDQEYNAKVYVFIYPVLNIYTVYYEVLIEDHGAYLYSTFTDNTYWYFIVIFPVTNTTQIKYCGLGFNEINNGDVIEIQNIINIDAVPILIVELDRGFLFVQSNFTILWVDGNQITSYEIGKLQTSATITDINFIKVNNRVYVYGSGLIQGSSTSGALFIASVDVTNVVANGLLIGSVSYSSDLSNSIPFPVGTRKFTNAVYDGYQYILFFTNQAFSQNSRGIITCDVTNPINFNTQDIYNNRLPVSRFESSNVAVSLASVETPYIRVYGPSLTYVDIFPLSYKPQPMSLYMHQEQLMYSNASCVINNNIWMFPGTGSTSNKIVKFDTRTGQFSYDPTTTPDIIGAVTFQNRVVSINVSSLTIYQTASPQVSVVNIPGGGVTSFATEPQYLSVTGSTGVYHMNCITGVLNKSYFLSNIQHSVMTYNSNVYFSNAYRTSWYRTNIKPFNLYSITQSFLTNNVTSVFGMSSTGRLNIFNKVTKTSKFINTGLSNPVFSTNIYSNAYFLTSTGTVYSPYTTVTTLRTGLTGASQIVSDFASNLFVTTSTSTMARLNIQLTGTADISTKSLVSTGSSFYAGTNLYSITSDSSFGTYNTRATPFFPSNILGDSNLYTSITITTKVYLFPGNVVSRNMFILDVSTPFNNPLSYERVNIVSDSNVMALTYDSTNSKIYALAPTNLLIYDIQSKQFSNLAFAKENVIVSGVKSIGLNPRSLSFVENFKFESIFFRKFIADNYFNDFLYFPSIALPSKVYGMVTDGRYIYTMSNIVYKIDTFSSSTNINTVLRSKLVSSSGYFDGRYVNMISNTHIIYDTIPLTIPTTFLASSIVTYAYLNNDVKDWLRRYILDYPISQIQTTTFVTNSLDGFFSVDFKGPIKEILIETNGGVLTNFSVFFNGNLKHKSSNNHISNVAFESYHTRSPTTSKNLYCWSLSSDPENDNPNGYVNMGRISEKVFNIQVSNPKTTVTMYGLVHNIVRMKDGLGGLVFNNYI